MDNQQGNSLHVMDKYFEVMAYSIGAMMGDGSVRKCTRRSTDDGPLTTNRNTNIRCMDLECVYRVCREVNALFGKDYRVSSYQNPNNTKMYGAYFGEEVIYDFFHYFIREKLFLPDEVFRASRKARVDFIAGLFDTDGYVAATKNKNMKSGYAYRVGYAARIRTLVEDVARLLMKLGVKVGKVHEQISQYETKMYVIKPNMRSFVDAGCYFHILRKAKKIHSYLMTVRPQSVGSETFRDYNAEPMTMG